MSKSGVVLTYAEWARNLAITPQERFLLGHTDTFVPARQYYVNVLPLFINQVADQDGRLPIPKNIYIRLLRGGILETNQSLGFSMGTDRYLIKDSLSNRNRLKEVANLPFHRDRYIYLNNSLLTISCAQAWSAIITQLYKLQQRLTMINWESMVDKKGLVDLSRFLKLGHLIDSGQLPVALINTALYLVSARLLNWLRTNHVSRGVLADKPIRFVYKNTLFLGHINDERREVLYVTPAMRPGASTVVTIKTRKSKARSR